VISDDGEAISGGKLGAGGGFEVTAGSADEDENGSDADELAPGAVKIAESALVLNCAVNLMKNKVDSN
jgi:hypothetical protein